MEAAPGAAVDALMSGLHEVLRVFTGPDGHGGSALGVVREGAAVPSREERQALAAEGVVDIYTPSVRLPFAGYPLVGVAWLLGVGTLRPEAGEVAAWREGEVTWSGHGRSGWRGSWGGGWRYGRVSGRGS